MLTNRRSVVRCALMMLFTAALSTACTPDRLCTPGVTQECACPAGAKGSQACRAGGDGWSECMCPKIEVSVPPVCSAGATQACACADGRTGAQTCVAGGSRWDACVCTAVAALPTEPNTQRPAEPIRALDALAGDQIGGNLGFGGVGLRGTGRGGATTGEGTIGLGNIGNVGHGRGSGGFRGQDTVGPKPYNIEVVQAVIGPSKPGGATWDPGGDGPDAYAEVRVVGAGSGVVRTTVVTDTTRPSWRQAGAVTINLGDELVIRLVDHDPLADDDIAVFRERFDGPRKYRFANPQRAVESMEINVTVAAPSAVGR